jgi:hypothetical protein
MARANFEHIVEQQSRVIAYGNVQTRCGLSVAHSLIGPYLAFH